ncbi:M50 family metallopeptidase [Streptomyces sp. NA04227]|uniref:metalloprotease n=1 Tax=Streptomyces sp. NA04227 TaxID=2742136 RepID=UPI0015922B42|nr:M50 family metallopeptidase [Streptomyces sp. NA04227]QKW05495.1 M50 family metallopeptidase [Streptomyces sp. NA04227]
MTRTEPGGLLGHRPALRDGILLSPPLLSGAATVHLVKDPVTGTAFEIGPKEYFLVSRLDGHRTLAEIGTEYGRAFNRRLGEANWQQLLGLLGSRHLLAGGPLPSPPERSARAVTGTLGKGSVRLVADADATTARLHRLLRPLLHPVVLVPLVVLCLAMEVVLALDVPALADDTWWLLHRPVPLVAVATLLWLSTALHELAHGIAARHVGGTVGEIGLRWRLPAAIMYCTVENYRYLSRRRQQLAVALAGAFANLLFLLPFWAWWGLLADDSTRKVLSVLLLAGSVQALVNLVPLPPLDGYTMLGHALRVTRLAPGSGEYMRLWLRDRPRAEAYPPRARRLYTAYGTGSALLVLGLLTGALLAVWAFLTTR